MLRITTNLSLCIILEMTFQIAAIFNKFPATRSVELHIFYILLIAGCWQKNPEIQRKARAYICSSLLCTYLFNGTQQVSYSNELPAYISKALTWTLKDITNSIVNIKDQ